MALRRKSPLVEKPHLDYHIAQALQNSFLSTPDNADSGAEFSLAKTSAFINLHPNSCLQNFDNHSRPKSSLNLHGLYEHENCPTKSMQNLKKKYAELL